MNFLVWLIAAVPLLLVVGVVVLSLAALVDVKYLTGFALEFWTSSLLPRSMFPTQTGFCGYCFRETKARLIGQFLELRYSRIFRVFATALRTFSELFCNCIVPAVAVRFFISLLNFSHWIWIGPGGVFLIRRCGTGKIYLLLDSLSWTHPLGNFILIFECLCGIEQKQYITTGGLS